MSRTSAGASSPAWRRDRAPPRSARRAPAGGFSNFGMSGTRRRYADRLRAVAASSGQRRRGGLARSRGSGRAARRAARTAAARSRAPRAAGRRGPDGPPTARAARASPRPCRAGGRRARTPTTFDRWASPTLTASGSPRARSVTSAAVHGPMPGCARSAAASAAAPAPPPPGRRAGRGERLESARPPARSAAGAGRAAARCRAPSVATAAAPHDRRASAAATARADRAPARRAPGRGGGSCATPRCR